MSTRTLTGLVVPFGKPGQTSAGMLRFDDQSVRVPDDPSRVKLLIEHDGRGEVIGHGTAFETTEAGLVGTFAVDDSPIATWALASAHKKLRDGLSIGIELDAEVNDALSRNPGMKAGSLARGLQREVSLVSIPAFDDSRVTDITGLDASTLPAAAAAGPATPQGAPMRSNIATAAGPSLATASAPTGLNIAAGALAHANGQAAAQATTAAAQETASAPAGTTAPAAAPAAATASQEAAPATAAAAPATPERPAAPPALAAGSVTTVTDPATYSLDGRGDSFVRDAFAASEGNLEAMSRLATFRSAMTDPDSAQVARLAQFASRIGADGRLTTAAVEVRDAGNEALRPTQDRDDLMLRAIDRGRPLMSRVRQIPITGPDPFRLPVFGEFDGVADHVEGTAHVTEGTVDDVGSQVVVPSAVSGAWRCSRELAESRGPAIDQLVVQEMVKDYRRNSEVRLVAKLEAVVAAFSAASVDTPDELLSQLLAHYLARGESPNVAAMGHTAFSLFATLKASDGRPYFPYLGPTNAAGTSAAGLTGLNVQGVDTVPVWSVDPTDIWTITGDDVASFESAPRLFRFEEVEGPGIIKFAIWGYQAAHVYRTAGVRRLKTVA